MPGLGCQLFQEHAELHPLVAQHAGIGGPARQVLVAGVVQNEGSVFVAQVHHGVRDPELRADPRRLFDVPLLPGAVA